jgi:hypothetical protein
MQAIVDTIIALFKWFQDSLSWIVDFIKDFPLWLFQKFAEGIVAFFQAIPVPSFFASASSAFASVPSGVVFFAQAFQIGPGIAMILSAYILRFVIRRIPFIG